MTDSYSDSQIKALTFEEAIKALDTIVRKLESGEVSLEDAIAAYETGSKLKAQCEAKLKQAQERIERIVSTMQNTITTQQDKLL